MFLDRIIIENFRNIDKIELLPNEKQNYIVGDNAQGKTNILEAIYFGTYSKSFRTQNLNELFGKEKKLKVKFIVENFSVKNSINLIINETKKKIFINDKEENIKKLANYINVILYYPTEISLLLKFPSYRRNLIDKSIYLINNDYINYYSSYLKCLKNRNICLKRGVDDYVWREKLIELACEIIKYRVDYIDKINSIINNTNMYKEESYCIKYQKHNIVNLYKSLSSQFKNAEERDKKNGNTSIGPHTDDIIFVINDKNLSFFGSEGQKKTFILLYKSAQIIDFKELKKYYPIFLVDDLASELDINRENIIINKILSSCNQSFITTNYKPNKTSNNTTVFNVKAGRLSD